jgi:hypothetical protein
VRRTLYCVCMPRHPSPGVALVAARYELVRELRVDGQTVEWAAVDTALDRPVVVQLLRPELARDRLASERFWQAARASARRTTTVGERVLDGGTDPGTGQPFVVRERPTSPPLATEGPRSMPRERAAAPRVRRRFDDIPRWLVPSGLVVALILAAAALRPGVEGWLSWVNAPLARSTPSLSLAPAAAVPASGAQLGQSTSTPGAPPTVAAAARSAPAPTAATPIPTSAATPVSAGQTRSIVNTDGRGVALRATPGGDRLPSKGYDEGATVQALEQSGEWTHIRGSDGREGWVLTVTLAP